jgi:hypothetical protein
VRALVAYKKPRKSDTISSVAKQETIVDTVDVRDEKKTKKSPKKDA